MALAAAALDAGAGRQLDRRVGRLAPVLAAAPEVSKLVPVIAAAPNASVGRRDDGQPLPR
jgi:hypothetical protein